MPKRTPPCPPNCPLRRPACQGSCPDFKLYVEQLKQDKIDKQKFHEQNSNWTDAGRRMVSKSTNYN